MRITMGLVVIIVGSFCPVAAQAQWEVVDARWRPDANPWVEKQVWDGWIWSEGWGEDEQFYPKYFKPAGSLHVILRNESARAAKVELTDIDGVPLQDVLTSPQLAGRVVWHLILPEQVEAGEWTECTVRLRSVPKEDVRLGFRIGVAKRVEVSVPIKARRVRLESISFSPRIDRLYIYIRSLDGGKIRGEAVRFDGKDVTGSCRWTEGPKQSALSLVEVELETPWRLGTYHLVEVDLSDGSRLAYPIRAWDNYFMIGLFGDIELERVKDAKAHGLNTYVLSREHSILDELGINYVARYGVGEGRQRSSEQSGTLFYNNIDEPDVHDVTAGRALPYMDRLGVNAEFKVLPRFRYHLEKDSRTPSMVLTDNTYKPLNYYVYGQTSDIFCTDPYVPLSGDQVDLIAHSLEVARDACAPCPLVATLWVTSIGGDPQKGRPPLPEEERIMVFYALGCGIKGLSYYADRDSKTKAEELSGVSHNKPLWEELGRINADVSVLRPYLSIGCPISVPQENEKVWSRSLLCGRDHMVVVVVNKGHYIAYNTKRAFAWNIPASDVEITMSLPGHFRHCRIQEVKDGALIPAKGNVKRGKLHLTLDRVDTARAFLVSANGK